jgi:alpha-pyrone synthase
MSYITSIGTANPPNKISQSAISQFMVRAMEMDEEDARKLRALFRMTGIESRYSVIEDYGKDSGFSFYPDASNQKAFPTTKQRMELFRKHALDLSVAAVRNCLSGRSVPTVSFTHLIVVSCTGLYAPGLDIDLVAALEMTSHVQRFSINFMGCYAAFNGLKLADTICKSDPKAKVMVVCTELCSIHFQRENNLDNMLSNALFGDGAAAIVVEPNPKTGANLLTESFFCDLATEGKNDMAWVVGDTGFEMKLTSYVPDIIRRGIRSLTSSLMGQLSKDLKDVSYFAIHPGGKKILEVIEEELGLTKEQNCFAYSVLRQYGNMSSPTVVFVINEIFKNLNTSDDQKEILSFAFGPGLTMESMLLKIEMH